MMTEEQQQASSLSSHTPPHSLVESADSNASCHGGSNDASRVSHDNNTPKKRSKMPTQNNKTTSPHIPTTKYTTPEKKYKIPLDTDSHRVNITKKQTPSGKMHISIDFVAGNGVELWNAIYTVLTQCGHLEQKKDFVVGLENEYKINMTHIGRKMESMQSLLSISHNYNTQINKQIDQLEDELEMWKSRYADLERQKIPILFDKDGGAAKKKKKKKKTTASQTLDAHAAPPDGTTQCPPPSITTNTKNPNFKIPKDSNTTKTLLLQEITSSATQHALLTDKQDDIVHDLQERVQEQEKIIAHQKRQMDQQMQEFERQMERERQDYERTLQHMDEAHEEELALEREKHRKQMDQHTEEMRTDMMRCQQKVRSWKGKYQALVKSLSATSIGDCNKNTIASHHHARISTSHASNNNNNDPGYSDPATTFIPPTDTPSVRTTTPKTCTIPSQVPSSPHPTPLSAPNKNEEHTSSTHAPQTTAPPMEEQQLPRITCCCSPAVATTTHHACTIQFQIMNDAYNRLFSAYERALACMSEQERRTHVRQLPSSLLSVIAAMTDVQRSFASQDINSDWLLQAADSHQTCTSSPSTTPIHHNVDPSISDHCSPRDGIVSSLDALISNVMTHHADNTVGTTTQSPPASSPEHWYRSYWTFIQGLALGQSRLSYQLHHWEQFIHEWHQQQQQWMQSATQSIKQNVMQSVLNTILRSNNTPIDSYPPHQIETVPSLPHLVANDNHVHATSTTHQDENITTADRSPQL